MRPEDLLDKLDDKPFKPFRIHGSDGSIFDVEEPEMLIVGQSSAVLPSQFARDEEGSRLAKRCRTIALNHIVQFSDLDEHVEPRTA